MAANILDLVSRALTPDTVQGISRFLGEDASAVQTGIGTLIPALLGGLASKASTPSGAASLFSLINNTDVDPGLTGSIGNVLGSTQASSLIQLGRTWLGGLFGADKVSGVASTLSSLTGMKAGSATNLLLMAVPILFSVLKRFIGENRLNAGGLASLLAGQKDNIRDKLDPRLTAALGLGSPASLLSGLGDAAAGAVRGTATAVTAGAGAASAAVARTPSMMRWLPWLIAGVVAVLLLSMLPQCGTSVKREAAPVATTQTPSTTPEPATAPATPAAPATTGAPATTSAAGTRAAMSLPAKVYFETGKAELNADGSAIVSSVARILAADSSAKVDITGYTDKTGNASANEELAKKRAMGVKSALEAAGVSAARVNMKPPMFVEVGAGGSDAEARRVDIAAAK